VRRAAARSQCANNLKQIALACHNYADNRPASNSIGDLVAGFPPGTLPHATLPPERRLSWQVALLPYLEQDAAYKQFDLAAGWDAPANQEAIRKVVKVYLCADWDREKGSAPEYFTTYIGAAGLGADAALLAAADPRAGVFGYDRRIGPQYVPDGTSNTLLILETARDNGPWAAGGPATVRGLDPADRPHLGTGRPFGGTHFAENSVLGRGSSIGCNMALVDGSVRFVRNEVAPAVLEAAVTVAGGEAMPQEW
jgi:Protein of unknown function (DUF1559)